MERIEKWACLAVSLAICAMFGVAWAACELHSRITGFAGGSDDIR